MEINDIIEAIRASRVRVTDHADEEAHSDRLKYDDVCFSVKDGEIIEDYPKDKTVSKLPCFWQDVQR